MRCKAGFTSGKASMEGMGFGDARQDLVELIKTLGTILVPAIAKL
jgi:hypothetical protein